MSPRIAEIQHAVAKEAAHLAPVEAAWERYRQATIRHLAAGEERDKAYAEFAKLFLTDK